MIKILNLSDFETINYSLPLITGEVLGVNEGEIKVTSANDQNTIWPIIFGKFKILVRLKSGINSITFTSKNYTKSLSLTYEPLCCKYFVKLVYITCCDSNTFQSPSTEDNCVPSALDRICLGAQMLQSFTAAKLKCHGLKPKTFRLEEIDGKPICHVFQSSLHLEEALKMSEKELWNYFAVELMNSSLREGDRCKFLGVLSFTRYVNNGVTIPLTYKEIKSLTHGYVALGAGGLALVGSGCLHTWPKALSEVPWRFGDVRKIDRMKFMDDSRNRGYYWACYATNLGAMLHELGHIFDLGHTSDGIMSRGFDYIHKFFIHDMFYCSHPFQKKYNPYYQESSPEQNPIKLLKSPTLTWTINEAASKMKVTAGKSPWKVPDPPEQDCPEDLFIHGSNWSRSSAVILHFHKWFNNYEDDGISEITCHGSVFKSTFGIRIVEFRDESNTAFSHLEYLDDSVITTTVDVTHTVPESSIPENMKLSTIFVQDSRGCILLQNFNKDLITC